MAKKVSKTPSAPTLGPITVSVATSAPITSGRSRYPWSALGESTVAGDGTVTGPSFFVPGRTKKQFSGSAYQAGKTLDKQFIVQDAEEKGVTGVRVWLLANAN